MKNEIIELAIQSLKGQITELRSKLASLRQEVQELKESSTKNLEVNSARESVPDSFHVGVDTFLSTKEVQKILGVCYNTLQSKIVKKGLLKPIRISQRKIRYSQKELFEFMKNIKQIGIKGGEDE